MFVGRERELGTSQVYELIDVNGVLTYWGVLNLNDEKYYLFIVDNEDNYSSQEITKLAEIIEIAMGMWKFTPDRDAKSEFVKTLIRGNTVLADSIKYEAGIDADKIMNAESLEEIIQIFKINNLDVTEADVYEAMKKDIQTSVKQICIDGGLSKNKYLMKLQSNLFQLPISIIDLESTCMGAVICTGLATKAFASLSDVRFKPIKTYKPKLSASEIQPKIDGWKKAMFHYLRGK